MLKKRHFKGNTSYEYAVIGGLVAVACITPLFFLGGTISTGMQDTNAKAGAGISDLTSLLTPNRSQSSTPGPTFQISFNPSSNAVVVNTNGMNIVGAPATAGTGTTLATYVYGALITQLSTTPPPGLDVNDPYMRAMRELGQAIQSLAIRSHDVIEGVGTRAGEPPGCRANCESALGPYFGVLNEKYAAFMTLANSSQYSAYSGLSNTVQTTSIFSNQLFGFGILQSLNQNGYNSWASGHGQFGAGPDPNAITGNAGSPPNGWGNPPPPLSALMINQNGTQVINVGSTPPPPPPAG